MVEQRLESEDSRPREARTATRHVPIEVVDEIRSKLTVLRQEWDRMFPDNPISSEEPDDE